MKKYLLATLITMSIIFVIPTMAETGSDITETQPAEETQTTAETPAEYGPHVASQNQMSNIYIAPTKEHQIGPGELLNTTSEAIAAETTAPTEAAETNVPNNQNRWGVVLNADERDLLARITMLESGGESSLGQQAVVEVILNRVYSTSYPNTVSHVLSQVDCGYRQFSTWKNRNSRAATPSAIVLSNVDAVLNGETNILPYDTVYFSRKAANKRVQARIGNHVFCNR